MHPGPISTRGESGSALRSAVRLVAGSAGCAAVLAGLLARAADGASVVRRWWSAGPETALAVVRVEEVVELTAVAVGLVLAAWFSVSLCAAAACATARAAGRRWTAGEHLVTRYAPGVVRRALLLSAGTGLALGGAGLPAGAVVDDAAVPGDLGWSAISSTAPLAPAPGPTVRPESDDTAPPPALSPPTAPLSPPVPTPSPGTAPSGGGAVTTPPPAPTPSPGAAPSGGETVASPAPAPTQPAGAAPAPSSPSAAAGAAPAQTVGATVTVRPGDTLWDIAAAHLPAGADASDVAVAWPSWYAANTGVIGPDPDLIRPGQRLVPPVDAVTGGAVR